MDAPLTTMRDAQKVTNKDGLVCFAFVLGSRRIPQAKTARKCHIKKTYNKPKAAGDRRDLKKALFTKAEFRSANHPRLGLVQIFPEYEQTYPQFIGAFNLDFLPWCFFFA
jgi:hypothetical protein